MSALSKTGSAIEVVGDASGFKLVKWFGKTLKATGEFSNKEITKPQLSERKEKLATSLRDLGHRIIITIDDVDRLEPAEVLEVLRLVRAVADLPNVIYLLCYNSKRSTGLSRRALVHPVTARATLTAQREQAVAGASTNVFGRRGVCS